jgi:hypothetical protein
MAAARDVLGPCTCPVCESERASARLSSKGLAYVVCDGCNAQVFARSGKSDEKLRARIKAAPAPTQQPEPENNPAPAAPPAPIAPAPAPGAKPLWGAW